MTLYSLELQKEIENEKQEYEDLTAKYEILEEEHVVTKAKLVMEKETLNKCVIILSQIIHIFVNYFFLLLFSQLLATRRELETTEGELQVLRETYTTKHDMWIKEKLNMQVSFLLIYY